jgi:hypothetical protein
LPLTFERGGGPEEAHLWWSGRPMKAKESVQVNSKLFLLLLLLLFFQLGIKKVVCDSWCRSRPSFQRLLTIPPGVGWHSIVFNSFSLSSQ